MKNITALAISLFLVASAEVSFAKGWRGIVPLQSTRVEVERLLGAPTKASSVALYYSLSDGVAVVWFQTLPCDDGLGKFGLGWNVPPWTVTSIGVIPKAKYDKKRFINEGEFKVENFDSGFAYYTNESDGLTVETYNGVVTSLNYTPTKKENTVKCPQLEKCCVDFFPNFDKYEKLSFEDEKARLDNFALQIKERLSRGIIVIYGQSRSERSKIMRRADRARQHLTQRHGIEPQRILIVDGGYAEGSATELDIYCIGGESDRIYLFPASDPKETPKRPKRRTRLN